MSDIKVCSFCGKTSEEVAAIIKSETACICNECTVANINILAKGGYLDKGFVPSWSLCSIVMDYLADIVDPLCNINRDTTVEWLQNQMGDLKIYEVREMFLEEKMREFEHELLTDLREDSIHEKIASIKNMATEKATIPYKIEEFLKGNVRP